MSETAQEFAQRTGEWLQWVSAQDKPDVDMTVLLFVPSANDPVWPGVWDGEGWQWVDGGEVGREVVAWAGFPEGREVDRRE